ncbi:hypothetical protein PHYPSEUDO_001597 [Phytophthora pseudosyringae]|uniref:Uncharacterized protein n=1 Tax=Phytophthora pseudosyringae TaxID=221518 RepID=A0A8T1VZP4_9STRA|nr:hypothetical protein PHYPSEUDO_001597 [Phytophthora pseudosyringae]
MDAWIAAVRPAYTVLKYDRYYAVRPAASGCQPRTRTSILLFVVFAVAFAALLTPTSAFSFTTLFDGDDDDASSSRATADKSTSGSRSPGLTVRSEVIPRQPLLDTADCFITEKEMTASRGGVPREDLAVYTTGNKVTAYTAANDFYDAVYDDLSSAKKGNQVMLAAWLTALVPLKPDVDPTGAKTGVREVFAGVVERGGNVSVLNWASVASGYVPFNLKARDSINSIPPSNGARAKFIFDDRINLVASHHQNTLVIASSRSSNKRYQPAAYVGDLANDRWDTMYHNNTAIRDAGNITYKSKDWVDGHIRTHGPAARDAASNFMARWNSNYLPCRTKAG